MDPWSLLKLCVLIYEHSARVQGRPTMPWAPVMPTTTSTSSPKTRKTRSSISSKAQARAEGRDFDLERSSNMTTADSWRSGYAAGTDGFGSWGNAPNSNTSKLTNLADTLGDLSFSHDQRSIADDASSSTAWSPTRKGGSSFTGRSAERDHAYIRTVERERNNSKPEDPSSSSQDTAPASSSIDSRQQSHGTDQLASDDLPDSPMPGGFATSTSQHRQASRSSSPTEHAHEPAEKRPFLNVPGLETTPRPRASQDSNLLTTLSPEAFKRVSTALDEVFGLIASEHRPSSNARAPSAADSNYRAARSSVDSDTRSFTSAVSNVRPSDVKTDPSHDEGDDDETADRTITGSQPILDANHIEQGRLAVASPLPGPLPGALPRSNPDLVSDMPESKSLIQTPSLVPSDSAQTVRDASIDEGTASAGISSLSPAVPPQHLSVSGYSNADSTLTNPSDRSSTATATGTQPQPARIVSTASTIEAPDSRLNESSVRQDSAAAERAAPASNEKRRNSLGSAARDSPLTNSSHTQPSRPFRTPEMGSHAFIASPVRSTLSRGDSNVSASSMRSSLTGPSASYQGQHSRKSSADKLALARSMAPHPNLREQPSLSSIRRHYRQHTRSATGSSEGSLLGGAHASRRSSGAMSPPPVLSRSARSPNYFPPPSSNVSVHDYASGFKPASAVSPAAAAALQSMANQASNDQQPLRNSVMDASNALRSAQGLRNSASTGRSAASPQVPNFANFASGSDRAAATSSPETGGTSISVHKRSSSLTHAKQLPQTPSTRVSAGEDGFSPSMYAPRPAPVPASHPTQTSLPQSATRESGLMPFPPSDPEQASKWRAMYGINAADAASLRASSEDATTDPNEEDDLWAKMASAPESKNAERPISTFPPSIAEERLADTGITFDQIADFQDRLIQTANGGPVVPPLPRTQANSQQISQDQQQKFAEAKSKGLASPNLVLGSEWGSKPAAEDVQVTNGKPSDTSHNAPMRRSFSSSVSRDPPVSPRAVMYDVTTSHRPTSPPLHSRNASLNGLPSLLELNGSIGHRNRESVSLSEAVDQASRLPPAPKTSRLPRHPIFRSAAIAEDPDSTKDQDVQYAEVQEHPYNAGYTSPNLRSGTSFTFPRATDTAGVGDSPRHKAQPFPPEDVWDRYGPQQGGLTPDLYDTSMSPSSSYVGADPTRLLDDVAAQTSAATRALKGADDGSVPTPPFRTKSISRKKSFKKVSKQISSPQLISTTQKLDHATQIPPSLETPSASSISRTRSNRSPGWGSIGSMGFDGSRSHVKSNASSASQMGSISKNSGYFHRRRSSSFGHDATPNVTGMPNGDANGTPSSAEHNGSERAADAHPNHPYMNGGANGGSLSRLFSKIKRNKNDQAYGGATIEPFPPELSAAARASEFQSQQQQQQQQPPPVTPDMPSLPAVERSTPWTLTRMPSTTSSADRGSSLRSPTSPIYTLPIDSTTMQRDKSRKKRNPIVLKRESEVILPDDPGYMPTAIIGKSPEQRAAELQEQHVETRAVSQPAKEADVGTDGQAGQEASTDTVLERDLERMDYCQSRNEGALAPPAAVVTDGDDEATTPTPTPMSPGLFPAAAGVAEAAVTADEQTTAGDETVDADADTTLLAGDQTRSKTDDAAPPVGQDAETNSRKVDARKSLRDTIVRRTIIIPAGIDFGDQRRSLFGSTRKSRRFAAAEDQPLPSSEEFSKAFDPDSPAVINNAALPEQEDEQGQSPSNGAQPRPQEAMSTFNSASSLRPDFRSDRASRVESSYAGSLYDLYMVQNGENIEFGSPGSDVQDLPLANSRRSIMPNTRASRMPETRRHIEVTERADGSVVWQVIAGLADRGSVYSDFEPRHSRRLSDASAAGDGEGGLLFKSPAGLTDEDSRSFFTKPRAAGVLQTPAFELDLDQPLPTRSAGKQVKQEVFDIANPPDGGVESATPAAASATRIVYHNDAQLASLLDVLAKGKDSAKFEFHVGAGEGDHRQSMAPAWGENVVDGNDVESHRNRVEAEIYTLLNRGVVGGAE